MLCNIGHDSQSLVKQPLNACTQAGEFILLDLYTLFIKV